VGVVIGKLRLCIVMIIVIRFVIAFFVEKDSVKGEYNENKYCIK